MIDFYIPIAAFFILALLEAVFGAYNRAKFRKTDWITSVLSVVQFIGVIRPLIVIMVALILTYFFPNYRGYLENMNFWVALIGYLLIDDFLHYWVHRIAHENDWLWKFHETHHASETILKQIFFGCYFCRNCILEEFVFGWDWFGLW
jgi:sterol desaturase/sphingolipid hydroxylase (fatty acid hydroxylase superfamily)